MDLNCEILECSTPNYAKHYLKEPITLSCGHSICKCCAPLKKEAKLICRVCKVENKNDLEIMQESKIIKHMLNLNLNNLFKNIECDFTQILIKLNENIDDAKERINLQFDFVKDEIEIKVESLKIQLDNLCQEMKKELEEKKMDYIKIIEDISHDNIESGKETLVSLTESKTMNENKSLDQMYEYDDILSNLRQLSQNLDDLSTKVGLELSKSTLEKDIIGRVYYNDPLLLSVRNGVCFERSLAEKPCSICVISENSFVVTSYVTDKLSLYDENFILIKEIDKINEKPFRSNDITSNQRDKLFFTDYEKHTVSSLDFNFNLVRTVGSLGKKNNQFNIPYGICHNDDLLYICDYNNKRIQVLDTQLNFKKAHILNFKPLYIKVIKRTACIRDLNEASIHFYETTTFTQTHKYDGHNGFICQVNNSYFFEMFENTLYCYNSDGTLKESVKLEFGNKYIYDESDCFDYFKGRLILCSYDNYFLI